MHTQNMHTYMHVLMDNRTLSRGAVKSRSTSEGRSTQAERSARTRSALLESAARGLSRNGYGNLILEQVASEAGYTRGALYHQFRDKEDLALAVIDWVDETWRQEVGGLVEQEPDPVAALIFCAPASVTLSVINGKIVVKEGRLTTVDLPMLVETQNRLARALVQ